MRGTRVRTCLVLLNCLAAEHLTSGNSIYITNTEYPDRIRDTTIRLGVGNPSDVKDPTRLIFIDVTQPLVEAVRWKNFQ